MTRVGERDQLISRVWLSVIICFWLGIIALHYHCYDLFVCLFFMLKLLQYCNYIIIVMQIKLMLLLLLPEYLLSPSPLGRPDTQAIAIHEGLNGRVHLSVVG